MHFYEYPYDNLWNVISSKRSWRQYWVHSLLTQRALNPENGQIKKELIKIKKIIYFFILMEKVIELKKIIFISLKKIIRFILFVKYK